MISVDDHVIEPSTLWASRLPSKYQDIGPRVQRIEGLDTWLYEDKRIGLSGVTATAGIPKEQWTPGAVNYEDIHPACYDPNERVKAMDMSGVLAEATFPTVPRFCGQIFKEAEDKALALLCVQAWNDFVIDEWSGSAPGRFLPLAMVPMWDAKLAAQEAERAVGKGARGIIFSENASQLGVPSIHDAYRYWDPLFTVANETGLPICMHIGSSSKLPVTAPDAPTLVSYLLGPLNAFSTLTDWLLSGNFFRFPNLKIALSEGEIGWMPFALMWLDRAAERQVWAETSDVQTGALPGDLQTRTLVNKVIDRDMPPGELFRSHVYGCFIEDSVGIQNLDLIGADNIMMETDFPHSDGTWPDSIEVARDQLEKLDDDTAVKLLRDNACRLFQFEPASLPGN
jgi:predicted TIM-barrel fold metal-dependent hydrolase